MRFGRSVLCLTLLLLPCLGHTAQLNVMLPDQPDLSFELADVQRLTISPAHDSLMIHLLDGTTHPIAFVDIQKLTFAELTRLTERETNVLRSFTLLRAYPNPFNASTTIEYDLPHPGTVSAVVCNISGQVVRHLIDDHQLAGSHQVVWDGTSDQGSHVASGMYICRVQLADQLLVTRLTYLK